MSTSGPHGRSTGDSRPVYRDGTPLDLSGLSAEGAQGLLGRVADGTFGPWAQTAASVGYCANPIRLVGRSTTVDATTGEVLSTFSSDQAPLRVLYRACGNRRADVCPMCSRTYARHTFEMLRAGLVGGKTIPTAVADNPLLFVTFTAPTFGHVHTHNNGKTCRPRARDRGARCEHGRPVACHARHDQDAAIVGAPICGDCYDWNSAVVWQWWAPELWRRTTIALRRALATALGTSESGLRKVASVQFAKVAEYQTRGLIHFHALIRLDGPDGPGTPAPTDGDTLARLVETAARQVAFDAPLVDPDDVVRRLAWGRQLDVRVVRDGHRTDDPNGPLAPEQVAGYLAKYATKDANNIRDGSQPRPHLTRLASTCRTLGARAVRHYGTGTDKNGNPTNPYRLLGKWAHMFGFRGHFSTKSRRYSITLGRLRRARAKYQALVAASKHDDHARAALLDTAQLEARLLAEDDETTLVIGEWAYQGTGWTNPGDEALALAAAARAREYAQWKAAMKMTNSEKGK